ncbi:MAG: glycosyltransferase family 2 protein [Patescibacteria group bacterium]|nr:glycosyltransferase family 2 protein [Patescibacteria group bacterium]MCL5431755.1 glycosyltransferase family 2 protein [Patescibacteria group bacterium]
MISAVILTNKKINVGWCDETVIITNNHITDFARERNLGLKKAKGDWVLFIDDDEEVTPVLRDEILHTVKDTHCNGFYLKRRDYLLGKWLRFGETANVRLLRLGKKGAGQWRRAVHEVWDINDPVGVLKNPLLHRPHPTVHEFIDTINCYTDLESGKFSYFRLFANPIGKFIQNYFLRLGFLDGFSGFVMAYMMSFYSLVVRIKQAERCHS